MTMVAIRLSKDNINTILATESISPDALEEAMKRTCLPHHHRHEKYYFIPSYDHNWKTGRPIWGWSWIRDDLFEDGTFTADMTQIDHQFVEITRN